MTQTQFYTYINVDAKLQSFIKTLVSIYQKRAQLLWAPSHDVSSCSVIFIDGDVQNSDSLQKHQIRNNQFMVVLNENSHIVHPRAFYINPKKQAIEILEVIQRCEEALIKDAQVAPTQTAPPSSPAVPQNYHIKLSKWPPLAVIRKDPNFAILATIVMNKKLSLTELAKESGFSHAFCELFIREGKNLGFLDLLDDAGVALRTTPEVSNEKQGFLSRIRTRLGLKRS